MTWQDNQHNNKTQLKNFKNFKNFKNVQKRSKTSNPSKIEIKNSKSCTLVRINFVFHFYILYVIERCQLHWYMNNNYRWYPDFFIWHLTEVSRFFYLAPDRSRRDTKLNFFEVSTTTWFYKQIKLRFSIRELQFGNYSSSTSTRGEKKVGRNTDQPHLTTNVS